MGAKVGPAPPVDSSLASRLHHISTLQFAEGVVGVGARPARYGRTFCARSAWI